MIVLSATPVAAMLSDQASISLFIGATLLVSMVMAVSLPRPLAAMRLHRLIPLLAVIGPALCAVLILVGAGSMLLSGHEVEVLFVMASAIGLAVIVLGRRLARPLADDLELVSSAIYDLAKGGRDQVTLPGNTAEAMMLMRAVEDLRVSLLTSEAAEQQANHHRKAVVAGLSHDLRTPLHSLMAAAEAIGDGVDDPGTHARHIVMNARALNRLVDDLFLVAQAESGFLRFDREAVELSELVEEIVESVQPTAAGRDVTVTGRVDHRYVVGGDEMAIGRILRNLLDNAIRHTPRGGAVGVAIDGGANGEATVSVVDGGPGFSTPVVNPDLLSRSRPAEPRRDHGGAGLGLSIATTLARSIGAKVELRPGRPGVAMATFRPV